MKIYHQVSTRIHKSTLSPGDRLWVKDRLEIFRDYSYWSLTQQTFQEFAVVITTTGIYRSVVEEMIANLPQGPKVVCVEEGNVQQRIDLIPPCDFVYSTRLDSDDMYHRDALDLVHQCSPLDKRGVSCSMFARGFSYDIRDGRWGKYFNPSSPFHTFMIPRGFYCDVAKMGTLEHKHGRIKSTYPTTTFPDWKFCVLRHGANTTTDQFLADLRRKGKLPPKEVFTGKNHACFGRSVQDFVQGKI